MAPQMKRGIPTLLFAIAVGVTTGGGQPVSLADGTTQSPQPHLFGEGVVSTRDDELGGSFSPDGKDLYFAKRTPATIDSSLITICVSHFENGRWGRPRIASFSGQYLDFSPSVSPDGSKLVFSSIRPRDGKPAAGTDLWLVERRSDGTWSEPHPLGAPINTDAPEQNARMAADGTLYFASSRPEGKGSSDLYRSRLIDGRYGEPENLGDAINTENAETNPWIAPDQSLLIFASNGRPDAAAGAGAPYPRSDLYVSFNHDGTWTSARRLPFPINTEATESTPFVSPDGRSLFFMSERNFTSIPMPAKLTYEELQTRLGRPGNGLGDIYEVDFSVVEGSRKDER